MASQLPINIQELLQLQQLGISAPAISFNSLTLDSDRFICVREKQGGDCIIIIDTYEDPIMPIREPITADSAIKNPVNTVIALKAQKTLKIFDLELKCELKSHQMTEDVTFWRWVNEKVVGIVTDFAVYHWFSNDDTAPIKMFDIHPNLAGSQIVNYHTDMNLKWLLLIGISAAQNNRAAGAMQLYSVERQLSQPIEGHAAVFMQYKMENNAEPSNLLAFAVRPAAAENNVGKLQITELGSSSSADGRRKPFQKKTVDINFPPEAGKDFPVALQASQKYGVLFMLTKFGYVYVYEIETAQFICMSRASSDPIFVTAPCSKTSGVLAVNRRGQVLSVSIDENSILPFIASQLHNTDLAVRFALRNKLVAADDLYTSRFDELFNAGKYADAARIAARAPRGMLRSPRTIQRFQAASSSILSSSTTQSDQSAATGFMSSFFAGVQKAVKQQTSAISTTTTTPPLVQYFEVLLESGKLNQHESLEFGRAVLSPQNKQIGLLEKWLNKDGLQCSEELGDLAKEHADAKLALSIYMRAGAHDKVVQCLAETGQFNEIVPYVEKADGVLPDYAEILRNVLQNNHQGVDFAKWLVEQQLADVEQLANVFMEQNLTKQCTAFMLDVLQKRGDRAEDAALQTKLLEININSTTPQVAEAIINANKFTHYDRKHIAHLCKQTGLMINFDDSLHDAQQQEVELTNEAGEKSSFDSLESKDSVDSVVVVPHAEADNKVSAVDAADADLPSTINLVNRLIEKMLQRTEQRQNDDVSVKLIDADEAVSMRNDFASLLGSLDELSEAQTAIENQRKSDFEQSQQQQRETLSLMHSENLGLTQRIKELETELDRHRNQAELELERSAVAEEAEQTAKFLQGALEEKQLEIERQQKMHAQLSLMLEEQAQKVSNELHAAEQSWRQQQFELEQQLKAKTVEVDSLYMQCAESHKNVENLQKQLAAQISVFESMQMQASNSTQRKDDEIAAQQQQQATIARLQAECERLKLHLSEQEQSYSAEFSACEARESQLHEQLQIAARRNDDLSARMAQAQHERAQLSTNNSSQVSELSTALTRANEQRTQADERCAQLQMSLEQLQIALNQIQREHSQALAREREHAHRIQAEKELLVNQYDAKRIECDAALQKVQDALKAGEDREVLMKTYEQKLKMLAPLLAERDMMIDDLQSTLARHTGRAYQPQHSRLRRVESKDSSSTLPVDSLNRNKSFDAGVNDGSTPHNASDLCDKSIVRDMLYKYFTSPKKYQPDMLALLCNVLEFSAQQRADMLKGMPNSGSGEAGGGSWLPRLPFGGGGAPDHSLRAEFVKYLLEQSESGSAVNTSDAVKKLEETKTNTAALPNSAGSAPHGLLLSADSNNTSLLTNDSGRPNGI